MVATAHLLTPDTQAILLLTGSLGQARGGGAEPLSPAEYHQLAQMLHRHGLRPADLLEAGGLARLAHSEPLRLDAHRVARLLGRGAALGLTLEAWTTRGLWVISRSDAQYPQRLRSRLGRSAPPILYGAGSQALLDAGGLAIVGSREVDDGAAAFTRALAARCARDGVQVVSGGARGVDTEAMLAALEAGGAVVGVLAESLARAAAAGKYRAALRAGRLALVTPYDPEAGFSVGGAMGRNRQIYALSDVALVVSATLEQGGTWGGAVENLAHGWVPLFVRATQPMLPGNQRLLDRGGAALADPAADPEISIRQWLERHAAEAARSPGGPVRQDAEAPPPDGAQRPDLFAAVWPYLEEALQTERTDRELADHLAIELTQARAWLRRAVESRLVRRLSNPVRYVVAQRRSQATTIPMFP